MGEPGFQASPTGPSAVATTVIHHLWPGVPLSGHQNWHFAESGIFHQATVLRPHVKKRHPLDVKTGQTLSCLEPLAPS